MSDAPAPQRDIPRSALVLRLVVGISAVAVPLAIAVLLGGALVAGHPAYPALLAVVAVAGIVTLARVRRPAKDTTAALVRRVLGAVLAVAVLGIAVWLRPLPATAQAADIATRGTRAVRVSADTTTITLTPADGNASVGLVFQPGAKVDPRAYLPLLERLAAQGYLVVVVKPPLGIGFLAADAPDAIRRTHPEVSRWVVGGHSLGGVVASAYAGKHQDVRGLLLWASYPAASIADRRDLEAVSVSGSNDRLSTPAEIDASRAALPPTAQFVRVEGANHACFGQYGEQPGDGRPGIDRTAAENQVVMASLALMRDVAGT